MNLCLFKTQQRERVCCHSRKIFYLTKENQNGIKLSLTTL